MSAEHNFFSFLFFPSNSWFSLPKMSWDKAVLKVDFQPQQKTASTGYYVILQNSQLDIQSKEGKKWSDKQQNNIHN